MDLRRAHDDELPALADLAATLQSDDLTHIVYLATGADVVLAEVRESTWTDVSSVAIDDGAIVGWLIGDIDAEIGRVWWLGPFVAAAAERDWDVTASALLADARARLPSSITQEEMAIDSRFERYRAWATTTEGFAAEEGSYVLTLDGSITAGGASADGAVREIDDADRKVVARLHDDMFPGTHTTGDQLVSAAAGDDRRRRLVFERGDGVVGYVAVELQPDGSGYIDYLGVAPHARRTGVASALVRAGVDELLALGANSVGLTVREGSTGARELYAALGFTEERLAVPLRRGFSLADPPSDGPRPIDMESPCGSTGSGATSPSEPTA